MSAGDPAVVVTGMGAVTAAGFGAEPLWHAVRDGRSAVQVLDAPNFENARIRQAAHVRDFDPLRYFSPERNATIDRFSAFALLAAEEALKRAGLGDEELGDRCAVIIGSGIGGAVTSDAGSIAYYVTRQRSDPMSIPKIMPSAAASQVSMRHGARGPVFCVSSACASSAQAIGIGMQMIRTGMVDRAIVGGSEAMLTPAVMRAWEVLRVLTPTANRPFSKGRDGMVLGEGAGVLVLERADSARQRGATALAELAGYGTASDANDLLRPDPVGAARAMQLALESAGLEPGDIGYVNAHGTGTVLNDVAETQALTAIFGGRLGALPVSSTKPVHGHTIGAAGAIELIVTISALAEQTIPPTINWTAEDPNCGLDAVPNVKRSGSFTAAMSNSFAFGGINAALVVRKI